MNARDPWFVVPRRVPTPTLRLFCFPFAGGGASAYRSWHELLPDEVEVIGVQPPGRESRFAEPRFTRLEELVPELAAAVSRHAEGRFAFFGHSLGGLVAFAVTRELRRTGAMGPELLIVSGRRAPHRPDRDDPIHDLPHDEFVARIREFAGTPEAVLEHEELLELVVPILRADFAISETHRYAEEPPLEIPIVSLGGADDPDVPVEDVEAWSQATTGPHTSRIFPGGHFYFLDDPGPLLAEVRRELGALLETAP